MANTIKIKSGSGTPTTSDIVDKELAFDRGANKLYINDNGSIVDLTGSGATGDIEGVTAGNGLTGGGTSGTVTLNIGAGTGIDVAADAISVDVSDFMSNGVNNRILTATGADAMNAEANLTWNGSDYFNITSADGGEGGIKLLKSSTDATHTAYHISHRDDNQSLIIYSYDGTTFRNWITLDEPNALLKLGSNSSALSQFDSNGDFFPFRHIDMGDSDRIKLGDSDDLQIVHDSGINFIHSTTSNVDIRFRVNDGGSTKDAIIIDSSDNARVKLPNDGQTLSLGAGNDLTFQHDGSNSYIGNGVGDLYITNDTNDKDIILRSDDGSGGTTAYLTIDGSATITKLHKNTKLVDSAQLQVGDSADAKFYHDGSNTYLDNTGANNFIIQQSGNDQDLVFRCDDGSGGVTSYLTLDGSAETINISKNMDFGDNVRARLGLEMTYN